MKKILFFLVWLFCHLSVVAQPYQVYSVMGQVTVNGKSVAVRNILSAKSILAIGQGAKLILFDKKANHLMTLKASGKGTVPKLMQLAGNSQKEVSGSYLAYITDRLTSDEKKTNTFMQSTGSAFREFDLVNDSIQDLLKTCTWTDQGDHVQVPSFMTGGQDIWVNDVPAFVKMWQYNDVVLAYWPLIGEWAIQDYPQATCMLTDSLQIDTVTHAQDAIYTGTAKDGRCWYLKKIVYADGELTHVKVLALIYPQASQHQMTSLQEKIKDWH